MVEQLGEGADVHRFSYDSHSLLRKHAARGPEREPSGPVVGSPQHGQRCNVTDWGGAATTAGYDLWRGYVTCGAATTRHPGLEVCMRCVLPASLLLLALVPQACQRDEATAPHPFVPNAQVVNPSTSKIAFTRNSQIYVMSGDG